ncbi:MAG: hypothetical protein WC780_19055 [Lentimicrobiaceae bacterium]|jgi:hypothetical protein
MTRKQLNQQAMLESVATFLGLHATDLAVNPVIATIAATLTNILQSIRNLKQVQDKTTKGATRSKSELETAIINGILKIGAALKAYATEAKNYEMLSIATFSETAIKHLRDSNLADKARTIHEVAAPVVAQLNIYQVGPEDVTALSANIPAYLQALPGGRGILNQTKQSTTDIQTKIDEGRQLLKEKLDVHLLTYKATNPTLYGEYQNARIIVDKAGTREDKQASGTGGPA